jgi:polyribonucleotide nucleotidyltransferase
MKNTPIIKSCTLPDGREITIESGKLATQADGSVVLKMGNTMLLATVVSSQDAKEGTDFLPLSVDYQEKFASMGKIPGGFLRREGRLSDYEILISRLVDRAIRPLFPDDYHADTQVNIQLISGDSNSLPDSLAAFAASAALSVSDIPFQGPISEVRVARVNGALIINPTLEQKEKADLDLIVAASIDNILMVEGEAKEVSEADMLEALKAAHEAIKTQCSLQIELTKLANKTVKRVYNHEENDEELKKQLHGLMYDKVYAVAAQQLTNKHERSEKFKAILEEYGCSDDCAHDGPPVQGSAASARSESVRAFTAARSDASRASRRWTRRLGLQPRAARRNVCGCSSEGRRGVRPASRTARSCCRS